MELRWRTMGVSNFTGEPFVAPPPHAGITRQPYHIADAPLHSLLLLSVQYHHILRCTDNPWGHNDYQFRSASFLRIELEKVLENRYSIQSRHTLVCRYSFLGNQTGKNNRLTIHRIDRC